MYTRDGRAQRIVCSSKKKNKKNKERMKETSQTGISKIKFGTGDTFEVGDW